MSTQVEDEIKSGLRGDESKQFEAICKAYDRYAAPLASYILERVPTLESHDVTSAVNDVFIELAKKAKKGNFKMDGSLASLLFQMARCNAIDRLREKLRYEDRNEFTDFSGSEGQDSSNGDWSGDEIAVHVTKKLADAPEVAAAWRCATHAWTPANQTAAAEIIRHFKIWIGSLPSFQRKVAQVMVKYFGDITEEGICDEIAKSGERPSLGSVKSARREIREKFESLMKQKERTQ